jgi:hypothetical protein
MKSFTMLNFFFPVIFIVAFRDAQGAQGAQGVKGAQGKVNQ